MCVRNRMGRRCGTIVGVQPTRPPVPFAPWGPDGPPVLHDGDGLETVAGPLPLDVPCPRCESPVRVDVTRLLAAAALDPGAVVSEALGLTVREPLPGMRVVVDPLGLQVFALPQDCPCGTAFEVVAGYGEYQPARWVATFLGVAPAHAPRRS